MTQQSYTLDALPCEDDEEWRELPGYAGAYAVSSHGRVARLADSVGRVLRHLRSIMRTLMLLDDSCRPSTI